MRETTLDRFLSKNPKQVPINRKRERERPELESTRIPTNRGRALELSNVNAESTLPHVRIRKTTTPYLGDDLERVKAMKEAIGAKCEEEYSKLLLEDTPGLVKLTKETKLKWLFEPYKYREDEETLLLGGTGELSQQFRRFITEDIDMAGLFQNFAKIMTEEIVQWLEEQQLYGVYYYVYKQKLLEARQKKREKAAGE